MTEREMHEKIDETAKKLVDRYLLAEVSSAIEFYKKHAFEEFDLALLDAMDLEATQEEKETAIQNSLSKNDLVRILEDNEIEHDTDAKIAVLLRLVLQNMDLDEIIYEYSVDVEKEDNEIMQWWLVDNAFSEVLKEKGEIILDLPIFDQVIWCRTCCGQALAQDYCFQAIAKERLEKYGS